MSRLPSLPPDRLDPEQRSLYEAILNGRRAAAPGRPSGLTAEDGSLVGPFNAYLRAPKVGTRLSDLGEALRFDSTLPKNLLELAVIVVARHWTAQFEWYAHSRLALAAGVAPEIVDAIARRKPPTFTDPDEALVHRFAREIVENHVVREDTYRDATGRFGEQQVFELTALVGFYGAVSAVLNTFEVPLPAGVDPLPA
jgi:4-carboxymuconolactone decarboxylase